MYAPLLLSPEGPQHGVTQVVNESQQEENACRARCSGRFGLARVRGRKQLQAR